MGGPALVDGYPLMCTDNFHVCDFKVQGKYYSTSQGYFQASKAVNQADHQRIRKLSHGITAWSSGSSIQLRPDWEIIKVRIMYRANKQKFSQNKDQKDQLISTKGEISCSGGFWGKWNGLILQRVRAELRQNGKQDQQTIEKIQKMMQQYEINKKLEIKTEQIK